MCISFDLANQEFLTWEKIKIGYIVVATDIHHNIAYITKNHEQLKYLMIRDCLNYGKFAQWDIGQLKEMNIYFIYRKRNTL